MSEHDTTTNVIPLARPRTAVAAAEDDAPPAIPDEDMAVLIAVNEKKKARRAEQRAHDNAQVARAYRIPLPPRKK